MSLMFFNMDNLRVIFNKTIIVTSLFFSTNTFSNVLIVKDESLAKDLTINYLDGKAIVNIERADIRGISHNYYTDFNIDEKGAIFNNPDELYVTTIINEVTSRNKTLLMGDLSINGKPANIIIANPNGIHCQGCSFNDIEKVTLINGISDKLNIGKYLISNKGVIEFSRGNMVGSRFVFDKINIISKEINFNKGVTFFSNKLNIVNGKQLYHIYNNVNSKFHKGMLLLDTDTIININEFNYTAGNNEFINKGTLNIGDLTIEAKGKLINYGEIKLLSGRIHSFLKKEDVRYPIYDFSKRVSNFNVKSLSNEENARFVVYNTDVKFNLSKGNFTNKGYLSLEHSHLFIKSGNFYHNTKGMILNNLSLITIEAENKVRLNGIIDTRYSENSVFINKGKVINIKDINLKRVLVKK